MYALYMHAAFHSTGILCVCECVTMARHLLHLFRLKIRNKPRTDDEGELFYVFSLVLYTFYTI